MGGITRSNTFLNIKQTKKGSAMDYELNFALVEAMESMGTGHTGTEAVISHHRTQSKLRPILPSRKYLGEG